MIKIKFVDFFEVNNFTWRFDENWESDFSHKTNIFSYDENVKVISLLYFNGIIIHKKDSSTERKIVYPWMYLRSNCEESNLKTKILIKINLIIITNKYDIISQHF